MINLHCVRVCVCCSLQLRKMVEVTKHLQTPDIGTKWIDTLCDVSRYNSRAV